MSEKAEVAPITYPDLIDHRYQVIKILGRGGMAIVYQVSDTTTGKEMALKQLLAPKNNTQTQEVTELFEHEYHILAQLAHPRIIEVYDFSRDPLAPYYTMELLDGGDIRELAPLPWKRACSIFIDVCSALSMIHSRRQIHCDLSPRNVRCTRDFKAKLIDFGAMTPMGPCKRLIGTPSCTPPEVVGMQTIDARADLYTMGATLYYALTGRFAYRASSFRELFDLWRSKPLPPSSIVQDIPKEIDDLVLSLISLDMMARPVNATEVMEKLSAAAGIEIDNTLLGAKAYLSKPMFVGRDEHIILVRKRTVQSLVGIGSTFFIEGAPGAGRSSFLDACVLEGRVAGATVLRADASDSYVGAWGVIKTLSLQLLDRLPEVALEAAKPHISLLGQILPDIVDRLENARRHGIESIIPGVQTTASGSVSDPFERSAHVWARGYSYRPPPPAEAGQIDPAPADVSSQELRPRILTAFGDWWLEVARQHCIVIAIDDIHRVDEPSAACIALLSQRLYNSKQVLAVTAETDALAVSPIAVKLLKQSAAKINLTCLSLENTEKLMQSIFGETANLKLVASKLQAITDGNPRAAMQLLQHLLDLGLIRYQSGAWTLPATINETDLPKSFSEAMQAKARKLGPEARQLAQTMAFNPDQRFSYDECQLLTGHDDTGRLIQSLDQLAAADILATDGLNYWISRPGWAPVLRQSIGEPDLYRLHLRMAELFEKRGNDQFRLGQHLLRGGQQQRALDVLIAFSDASKARTDRSPEAFSDLIRDIPKNWLETFQEAIDICEKVGRPRRDAYALRSRLIGLFSLVGTDDNDNIIQLLKQLCADSGLTIYHELGTSVAPQDRLKRTFQLAQQRYDQSPESERVLSPFEAVRELAKAVIPVLGSLSHSYDYAFWLTLPSLAPFMTLSSALEVVDKFIQAIGYRISSRCDQARQAYREILERTGQPDHAGLEGTHLIYMRFGVMRGLGMMEAAMGIPSALDWADAIQIDPLHQPIAMRIRMLYHTWQGSVVEAEECRRRIESLHLTNSPVRWFEGQHLGQEVLAYALSDDLMGVLQTTDGIETMALNFANWRTTHQYARAEYQRIRGDAPRALEMLCDALKHTAPGRNHDWPYIASAYLRTLNALGEYSRSEVEGRLLVKAAEEQSLGFVASFIKMPLAEAEARQAHAADAIATADSVIDALETMGTTGLSRGLAYETRTRVAAIVGDVAGVDRNAKLCAEQYSTGRNPALTSKYQKLMYEVRGGQYGVSVDLTYAADLDLTQRGVGGTPIQIATLLESCQDAAARASRVLNILIESTNSEGGFLYTVKARGIELSASEGPHKPPPEMDSLVQTRLNEEIEDVDENTEIGDAAQTSSVETSDWAIRMGTQYRSVLLGHYTPRGFAVTGMAVFVVHSKKEFRFPGETVAMVSRSLLDSGDVVPVYVTE